MPTRENLKGQVGNVEVMELDVLADDGQPFSLVGFDLEFYIKRYSSDSDLDAVIFVTRADPEMTIVEEVTGKLTVEFTILDHWRYWWRLDVLQNDEPSTALYGYLEMEPV